MKRIAALTLALMMALSLGAGALAAQYPTTQSFIDVLEEYGLAYDWLGVDDDGDEGVFLDTPIEGGHEIKIRYYFDPDLDLIQVRVFNYIDFDETYLGDVLIAVNDLNYDYRYVKFYVDMTDFSVTLSEDLIVRADQEGLKDICFDSLLHMYVIAEEAWEKLSPYAK